MSKTQQTCLPCTSNNGDQPLAHIPVHIEVLGFFLEAIGVHIFGLSPLGPKGNIGYGEGPLALINALLYQTQMDMSSDEHSPTLPCNMTIKRTCRPKHMINLHLLASVSVTEDSDCACS